ncbi:MAG: tetratricopeptide repeat protein [Halieaceae bacterium]|jgi:tetratricopeptide (TPR) repeat protein|nr:tetratricopeptide repeat protein [Halieaceae bacterium]
MREQHFKAHLVTRLWARPLAALALAALLGACAGGIPSTVQVEYTPEELVPERAPFYTRGDVNQLPPVDPLALDDDMHAFLDDIQARSGSPRVVLNNILRGLLGEGTVIEYDNFKTYTAQETFHARQGNCLAFTNLFVALAREAGLDVVYQEVDIPHNWERRGETWVYNRHISAFVDLDMEGEFFIDFNLNPTQVELYDARRISDRAALSQYHNNMGVYWIMGERYDLAYLHLQEAIRLANNESWFWTNLGVLYSRVHDDKRAEAAWLHAVDLANDHTAESNLARYYRRIGELELAEIFQERVQRFRLKNPYYRYELAETAYYSGDYETAIRELKAAIRIRENDEHFHRLLGLAYVRTGAGDKASASFAAAEEVTKNKVARQVYSEKQKILRQGIATRQVPEPETVPPE